MINGEYLLQLAIKGAFDSLAADPSQAGEFLTTLAENYPQRFGNLVSFFAKNNVPVSLGWPTEPPPPSTAFVAITVNPTTEEWQPIGGFLAEDDTFSADGSIQTSAVESYGSFTSVTYNVTTYSPNIDLLVAVSAAVRWGILVQRFPLEQAGINQMRLSAQDLAPDPRWQGPDYVYRRNVGVAGTVIEGYKQYYTTFLRQVNLDDAYPTDPTHPKLPK